MPTSQMQKTTGIGELQVKGLFREILSAAEEMVDNADFNNINNKLTINFVMSQNMNKPFYPKSQRFSLEDKTLALIL